MEADIAPGDAVFFGKLLNLRCSFPKWRVRVGKKISGPAWQGTWFFFWLVLCRRES